MHSDRQTSRAPGVAFIRACSEQKSQQQGSPRGGRRGIGLSGSRTTVRPRDRDHQPMDRCVVVIANRPKLRVDDFPKVRAAEREVPRPSATTSAAAAECVLRLATAGTCEPGEAARDDADAAVVEGAQGQGRSPSSRSNEGAWNAGAMSCWSRSCNLPTGVTRPATCWWPPGRRRRGRWRRGAQRGRQT